MELWPWVKNSAFLTRIAHQKLSLGETSLDMALVPNYDFDSVVQDDALLSALSTVDHNLSSSCSTKNPQSHGRCRVDGTRHAMQTAIRSIGWLTVDTSRATGKVERFSHLACGEVGASRS